MLSLVSLSSSLKPKIFVWNIYKHDWGLKIECPKCQVVLISCEPGYVDGELWCEVRSEALTHIRVPQSREVLQTERCKEEVHCISKSKTRPGWSSQKSSKLRVEIPRILTDNRLPSDKFYSYNEDLLHQTLMRQWSRPLDLDSSGLVETEWGYIMLAVVKYYLWVCWL